MHLVSHIQPANIPLSATFSKLSPSPDISCQNVSNLLLPALPFISSPDHHLPSPTTIMHAASKPIIHQLANAGPWSLPVFPCISSGSRTRNPKKETRCTPPLGPMHGPISKYKQQIIYWKGGHPSRFTYPTWYQEFHLVYL